MPVITLFLGCGFLELKIVFLFVQCNRNLDADKSTEEHLKCRHTAPWKCPRCSFWNTDTRIVCGNRYCQQPSPQNKALTRLFLGQLRKRSAVPYVQWLLDSVVPHDNDAQLALLHAENHRNADTGREKGCLWAYISDNLTKHRLHQYNHRIFADIFNGAEGVWVCSPWDVAALLQYSTEAPTYAGRPRVSYLPRNPIVAETPLDCAQVMPGNEASLPPHHQGFVPQMQPQQWSYDVYGNAAWNTCHQQAPPYYPPSAKQYATPIAAWQQDWCRTASAGYTVHTPYAPAT